MLNIYVSRETLYYRAYNPTPGEMLVSPPLCSPEALLSQHQVLHQLFLWRSLQQPFRQFLPNPRFQVPAQSPFRSPISFKEDAPSPQAPPDSEGWSRNERKQLVPGPGVQNVRREPADRTRSSGAGAQGAAEALTNILIERIGGKERHLHGAPRCPQGLPADTTGVRVRRRKDDSSGKNNNRQVLDRVHDRFSPHQTAATAAAAAATAREPRRPPAWSLSGIWAASALPAQNLPRTCPTKTGPTAEPPPPYSTFD